jgi:hypothetical protein
MADDRYREQAGWRGSGRGDSIFGGGERGGGGGGGHQDRGFFERAGEQVRSWFGDDERGGSRGGGGEWDRQEPWGGGDYAASSFGGGQGGRAQSWSEGQRGGGGSFGSGSGRHPLDDHYRSWRDRQIAELDREYEEYCRHRQQQFETDFHSWRQTRQSGGGSPGAADTQATSTTTGGTGMGSSASFGSSNPDAESGDTGSEEAPRTRTNLP